MNQCRKQDPFIWKVQHPSPDRWRARACMNDLTQFAKLTTCTYHRIHIGWIILFSKKVPFVWHTFHCMSITKGFQIWPAIAVGFRYWIFPIYLSKPKLPDAGLLEESDFADSTYSERCLHREGPKQRLYSFEFPRHLGAFSLADFCSTCWWTKSRYPGISSDSS